MSAARTITALTDERDGARFEVAAALSIALKHAKPRNDGSATLDAITLRIMQNAQARLERAEADLFAGIRLVQADATTRVQG